MSMSNRLSNRRCMPNNHGIPLSKQRYLGSVSLSRTLRCINLFPIQPSFRSESNQRYWQEKCSFVSIAFNLRMTFSIGNCCTFLTIIVHFLKSIFDSNNRTSHVSYTVLQTSQELRMLSPSLFIQRSQCNC